MANQCCFKMFFTSNNARYDFKFTMSYILWNNLPCTFCSRLFDFKDSLKEFYGFTILKYSVMKDILLFSKFHEIDVHIEIEGACTMDSFSNYER